MAVKKTYKRKTGKNQSHESQSNAIVIFWLVFAIVIIFVFSLNAPTIKKNFDLFMSRITTSPGMEGDLQEDDYVSGGDVIESGAENTAVSDQIVAIIDNAERSQNAGDTASGQERQTAQDTSDQTQSQPSQTQTEQQTPPPRDNTVRTIERTVYFAQIDKDGQILQSKVTRRIPVSETPMMDVLTVMLSGPSVDEINRGVLNLIPRGTRMLNATVRGSTAYISFSEDFLFNTFGVEGYVAQLRQIVWTVTEFSNVNDVQILIEGRRIDYLGEGIYIGSPISRQSF